MAEKKVRPLRVLLEQRRDGLDIIYLRRTVVQEYTCMWAEPSRSREEALACSAAQPYRKLTLALIEAEGWQLVEKKRGSDIWKEIFSPSSLRVFSPPKSGHLLFRGTKIIRAWQG